MGSVLYNQWGGHRQIYEKPFYTHTRFTVKIPSRIWYAIQAMKRREKKRSLAHTTVTEKCKEFSIRGVL